PSGVGIAASVERLAPGLGERAGKRRWKGEKRAFSRESEATLKAGIRAHSVTLAGPLAGSARPALAGNQRRLRRRCDGADHAGHRDYGDSSFPHNWLLSRSPYATLYLIQA